MLYFSQFFTRFFGGFTEFVLIQMYVCSLLVRRVADNRNLNESYIFLNEEHTLCTQFSPQSARNCILGLWNFKIFRGSMPPDSSRGTGLTPPCWYSRVLYSNLLATFIFTETPAKGYNIRAWASVFCRAIRNTVSVPTFWSMKCDTLTKQKHAQEWKQKIDPHYFELRYDFMQAYIFPVHQCSVCTFSEAILCHEASL